MEVAGQLNVLVDLQCPDDPLVYPVYVYNLYNSHEKYMESSPVLSFLGKAVLVAYVIISRVMLILFV